MATVLATGLNAAAIETTSAQGFFQRLFNPEAHRMQQQRELQAERRERIPNVTVSSPRYLNYSPDSWKTVSLAPLSEKKTAEVQPDPQGPETEADAGIQTEVDTVRPEPVILTAFDEVRPVLKDMSLTVLPEVGEALLAYYRDHPNFVWVKDGKPTEKVGTGTPRPCRGRQICPQPGRLRRADAGGSWP
ncbi:hypothetical protein QW131_08815 [Roseibium salinum]|nr:hypothetical protein [Roseibium salinum]